MVIAVAELIKELKENDKKAALDLLNKAKATCADYGVPTFIPLLRLSKLPFTVTLI